MSLREPQFSHPKGFALVVTLSLMILLTIIAVGLLTLSSISLRASTQGLAMATARSNAKLAMMLALGELQKSAGPDQRVTARGDILATNTTNPHWTAVWKTGANPLDTGSQPQRTTSLGASSPSDTQKSTNAVWLVSGTTPDPLTFSGTTAGANPTAVALASHLGANPTTVMAPLVTLQTANSGRGAYAYWISDEGVKAKVNIKDPTLNSDTQPVDPVTDLAKNQLHFSAPQAMAAHKILPDTLATDFRQAAKVDQVLTPQTLPLLPAVAPTGYVSNRYLADVTTYSYGVLADVRNGGLRKDLTAAFEDTGANSSKNYAKLNPAGTNRVYTTSVDGTPATAPSRGVFDGLRWMNLFYYYNLYKATLPTVANMGGLSTPSQATRPAGIGDPNPATNHRPYAVSMHALGWNDGSGATYGVLAPVCLGMRWDVALSTRRLGTGAGATYVPRLHYYPQITLYNPYSVAIKSSHFNYKKMLVAILASLTSQDTIKLTIGGVAYIASMNQSGIQGGLNLATAIGDSSELAPGEIRVYGLSAATAQDVPAAPGSFLTNSIATACQFPIRQITDGLVSQGYDPAQGNVTDMLYDSTATGGGTYSAFPPMADAPVTLTLSGTVMKASFQSVVALPRNIFWPYLQYASQLSDADPGNDAQSIMQSGTPGTLDTGSGALAGGQPLPAVSPYNTTLSQLDIANGNPTLLWSVYQRKKGLKGETSGYSNVPHHIPAFMGNSEGFNLMTDKFSAQYWDELYIRNAATLWQRYDPTSLFNMNFGTSGFYVTTSWGNRSTGVEAVAPGSATGRIVLADVPIQPLVSLGQLMHLKPFYWEGSSPGKYWGMGFGSMFTGGSYPNPSVPLNATVYDTGPANVGTNQEYRSWLSCDHSFLANQALFDTYYFSTIPPAILPTAPTSPNPPDMSPVRASVYPETWVAFNAANPGGGLLQDSSMPFLNSRMVPYRENGAAPALADLRDMDKAAANLLVNGAFNINSTSVDAWRSLLSSLSGNDLSLWNASTQSDTTFTSAQLHNPIPRFWSSAGNAILNSSWCGVRAITDTEVTQLATQIVAQVKLRGPFLSMADFLNRRLGSDSELTRSGALQAAIDTTTPDINAVPKASGETVNLSSAACAALSYSPQPIPANMKDANGNTWNTAVGIPGYLMQQDLVQAFSPVMTARSDTFVIRTCGESSNPVTHQVDARAYAEAVVQRVPAYLDSSDPATATLGDATPLANLTTDSINKTFGRRFEIISFRWLSPNEL